MSISFYLFSSHFHDGIISINVSLYSILFSSLLVNSKHFTLEINSIDLQNADSSLSRLFGSVML